MKIVTILMLVAGLALTFASTASAQVFSADFENESAAAAFGTGDFDPTPSPPIYINEANEGHVQVVSQATSGGTAQVKGTQSLKIDANSGYNRFQHSGADLSVSTLTFDVYLDPGDAVGTDRILETFVNDPGTGRGFDLWSIRIDENGMLYRESFTAGWVDTETVVAMNTWNSVQVSTDGPSGIVNLYINGTQVTGGGSNLYLGTDGGDSFNDLNMFAGDISGAGAVVFFDNIQIFDTFAIPEPSTAMLLALGGCMIYGSRKKTRRC